MAHNPLLLSRKLNRLCISREVSIQSGIELLSKLQLVWLKTFLLLLSVAALLFIGKELDCPNWAWLLVWYAHPADSWEPFSDARHKDALFLFPDRQWQILLLDRWKLTNNFVLGIKLGLLLLYLLFLYVVLQVTLKIYILVVRDRNLDWLPCLIDKRNVSYLWLLGWYLEFWWDCLHGRWCFNVLLLLNTYFVRWPILLTLGLWFCISQPLVLERDGMLLRQVLHQAHQFASQNLSSLLELFHFLFCFVFIFVDTKIYKYIKTTEVFMLVL